MFYYFKKGKNATEMQKKKKGFVQCMEKVLCHIEHVKSGLQSFMLENAAWSGRPVEVDSNQIKTLRTISIIPLRWKLTFKISKSSLENHLHQLGYVNHFDVWVPRKLRRKNNLLDHIPAFDSLLKHNKNVQFLKTNCDSR